MRRHTQLAAAALYPPIGAEPTTVPDRAGGNDGTNNGAKVALVDGVTGLEFDGVGDFVNLGNPIPSSAPFTIEFQERTPDSAANPDGYFLGDNQNFRNLFFRRFDSDSVVAGRIAGVNFSTFEVGLSIVRRHSITVSSAGGGDWYVNASIRSSVSGIDWGGLTSDLWVGDRGDLARSFEGFISDVRIWNYARTQSEIQADMHKRLTGNEPGLVGYWPMQYGAHQ